MVTAVSSHDKAASVRSTSSTLGNTRPSKSCRAERPDGDDLRAVGTVAGHQGAQPRP